MHTNQISASSLGGFATPTQPTRRARARNIHALITPMVAPGNDAKDEMLHIPTPESRTRGSTFPLCRPAGV
eukprot:5131535-Pyramimonas_sp.AAC.1